VAADHGAVHHVLPVVGQSEFNQRFEQRVPDALRRPTSEPHVDRVPLSVALVHVATTRLHPDLGFIIALYKLARPLGLHQPEPHLVLVLLGKDTSLGIVVRAPRGRGHDPWRQDNDWPC
jgi:hypothetical protein